MRKTGIFVLIFLFVSPAGAGEDSMVAEFQDLQATIEIKIQKEILDPLLGTYKAFAFVSADYEVEIKHESREKTGTGMTRKMIRKDKHGDKSIPASKTQVARQTEKSENSVVRVGIKRKDFRVRILHDKDVPAAKLALIRKTLVWAFRGEIRARDIDFKAAAFRP